MFILHCRPDHVLMYILADSQKGKTGTGFVVGLYCLLGQFPTTLVKSSVLLLNTPNEIANIICDFFFKVVVSS